MEMTNIEVQDENFDQEYASSAEMSVTEQQIDLLNQEYEEFLYIVSHDFSAPLRQIDQFSRLLEKNLEGQLNDDSEVFLSFINQAATRAQNMLAGLMELSSYSVAKKLCCEFDFATEVDTVASNLRKEFPDKPFALTCSALPVMSADRKQISVLFYHLMKNAIVYSREDGPIEINIEAKKKYDHWEFVFQDNGIGIEPGHETTIFKPYRKLVVEKEHAGVGMGLAHCKKIMQCHEGAIYLEQSNAEGSKFVFTIPFESTTE